MLDPETARQVRWHHAMNPKPVPKIANLQTRMDQYESERRGLAGEMALCALVGACMIFPLTYFAPLIFSAMHPSLEVERGPLLWGLAVVVWIAALAIWYRMMRPTRPTEQDVLDDVAIRRQVGMDDTVAE